MIFTVLRKNMLIYLKVSPTDTIVTVVNALVLSHVRYCLPVYGNCTQKNLYRLEKILNFAARVISGRRKYDHVSDVRNELGCLSAADMSSCDTLVLLHKVTRAGEPSAIARMFSCNVDVRARSTRQDSQLSLPSIRTEAGRRRFAYRAAMQYNQLPVNFRDMSARQFKSSLKRLFRRQ